jgi:hypothetical protein
LLSASCVTATSAIRDSRSRLNTALFPVLNMRDAFCFQFFFFFFESEKQVSSRELEWFVGTGSFFFFLTFILPWRIRTGNRGKSSWLFSNHV